MQQESAILGKKCVRVREKTSVPELNTYPGIVATDNISEGINMLDYIDPEPLKTIGSGNVAEEITKVLVRE